MDLEEMPEMNVYESESDDCFADPLDDSPNDFRKDMRLARMSDYEASLLAQKDPLQACVGIMNVGLMEIGVKLQAEITAALADSPASGNADQRLKWALDSLLRITRQNDRFAQFASRAKQARGRAARLGKRRNGNMIPTK